jgi:hypothetical protein
MPLSQRRKYSREAIDVSIFFSHHKRTPTPRVADNKAKVGQVAFLVYFNSDASTFEIQQYRNGDTIERNEISSIPLTVFASASDLFDAIQQHLALLKLDINKNLFCSDGNLGEAGKAVISEIFKSTYELFVSRESYLIVFSNTLGCCDIAKALYPEVHAVEGKLLGQTIVDVFGSPLKKAPDALSVAAAESKPSEDVHTQKFFLPELAVKDNLSCSFESSRFSSSLLTLPTLSNSTSTSLRSSRVASESEEADEPEEAVAPQLPNLLEGIPDLDRSESDSSLNRLFNSTF